MTSLLLKCTVPVYPVATVPSAAKAVTVAVWTVPAVVLLSPLRPSVAGGAELMVTVWLPVSAPLPVSAALTVWPPAVFSVTGNWCTPASVLVNV